MFNMTDGIVLLLFLFYLYSGWRKGILKSLLAPISFVICFALAWMYFKKTHNVLLSFSICLFGPLLISNFVSWIIDLKRDKSSESVLDAVNRLLGSAVTVVWGMTMCLLVMMTIAIYPMKMAPLQSARENILNSTTYSIISTRSNVFFPNKKLANTQEMTKDSDPEITTKEQNPTINSKLAESPEYQDVINDPRIKELFADPEVKQMILDKDYMKLLQNPKFAKIFDDPALISKMLKMQSKINKQ